MLRSPLFQRSAWAGLIGGFLDQVWSLPGLVSMILTVLAPLTVRPAAGKEHGAMSLAGLGALAGGLLAVAPSVLLGAGTGPHGHELMVAAMVVMSGSMGGMLGGGWHAWRTIR